MDKIGHKKLKNFDLLIENNKAAIVKSKKLQNEFQKKFFADLKD